MLVNFISTRIGPALSLPFKGWDYYATPVAVEQNLSYDFFKNVICGGEVKVVPPIKTPWRPLPATEIGVSIGRVGG